MMVDVGHFYAMDLMEVNPDLTSNRVLIRYWNANAGMMSVGIVLCWNQYDWRCYVGTKQMASYEEVMEEAATRGGPLSEGDAFMLIDEAQELLIEGLPYRA